MGRLHIELSIRETVKLYDQFEEQLSDTSKQPIQGVFDAVRQVADSSDEELDLLERDQKS